MDLVVAATSLEIKPLRQLCPDSVTFLVTGVGLVETAFNLTRYLFAHPNIDRVVNVGIAGGFPDTGVSVLDCCLASSETVGDLGICYDSYTEPLDPAFLTLANKYPCDNSFQVSFLKWLSAKEHKFVKGSFLSVNGVSGTRRRGLMINHNQSICENMEGAAVARVCIGLDIDWLEFRVISNLVEDRDVSSWQIEPAIDKYTRILAAFLQDNQA